MRIIRLLWKAVGGKLFILPATVSGALALLDRTGLSDVTMPVVWLIVATPLLLWIIGGLLIQASNLQAQADIVPTPDWSMREAFRYLMIESSRAVNTNPEDEHYYTNVQGDVADAARLGRVVVWARDHSDFRGGFRKVLKPFDKHEWNKLQVDLATCVYNSPRGPQVVDYSTTERTRYDDVQVCRAQVMALWPKAGRFMLYRDPHFNRRKDFQSQELATGQSRTRRSCDKLGASH